MPEGPFGHDEFVCEDGALVEDTVAVPVFQHANEPGARLDQFFLVQIVAVSFGNEQSSAFVETSHHRIPDQRSCGREFDRKPIRYLNRRRGELAPVVGVRLGCDRQTNHHRDELPGMHCNLVFRVITADKLTSHVVRCPTRCITERRPAVRHIVQTSVNALFTVSAIGC